MLSVKANSLSVGANMNWTGAAGNADSDRDRNADSFFLLFFWRAAHSELTPCTHLLTAGQTTGVSVRFWTVAVVWRREARLVQPPERSL